jgi:hypothetical protein
MRISSLNLVVRATVDVLLVGSYVHAPVRWRSRLLDGHRVCQPFVLQSSFISCNKFAPFIDSSLGGSFSPCEVGMRDVGRIK